MSKIVFIEQFYYPEGWGGAQLAINITMYLALKGKRVDVICGGDQYVPLQQERIPDPKRVGIRIRKVPRLFCGPIQRHKLLKQLLFYVGCLPMLICCRRPRVFVSQTNPPMVVILAALAAALHRATLIIVAQDVYPEVVFASGMLSRTSVVGKLLTRLFAWAYGRADRVVALGNVMATLLTARGVSAERIRVIPNWATGASGLDIAGSDRLRAKWNLIDKHVVLYTGNLGIAHDVETTLRAVQRIASKIPLVRLVFVGGGARLGEALRLSAALGLTDVVQFHPAVPMSNLPAVLALADVALVTLQESFSGVVVPSKTMGYMARGLPTLYVGPNGDLEELLTESGAGVCCKNGDVATLVDHMSRLIEDPEFRLKLGRNAAAYYKNRLRRELSLQKYQKVVEEAVSLAEARAGATGR